MMMTLMMIMMTMMMIMIIIAVTHWWGHIKPTCTPSFLKNSAAHALYTWLFPVSSPFFKRCLQPGSICTSIQNFKFVALTSKKVLKASAKVLHFYAFCVDCYHAILHFYVFYIFKFLKTFFVFLKFYICCIDRDHMILCFLQFLMFLYFFCGRSWFTCMKNFKLLAWKLSELW